MSFVVDQVRRVDGQLDRVQLSILSATAEAATAAPVERELTPELQQKLKVSRSPRALRLQVVVNALSTNNASNSLLDAYTIKSLLSQAKIRDVESGDSAPKGDEEAYIQELEWLVVGKATAQTYGLVLNILLSQIIPLNDDIWYWDDVLSSYRYTALYSIQTSPLRLLAWTKDIYKDATGRLKNRRELSVDSDTPESTTDGSEPPRSFSDRWKQFYSVVRESVNARAISDIQKTVISPLTARREEVKAKQKQLRHFIELSASGLGVLMDEGLSFGLDEERSGSLKSSNGSKDSKDTWKGVLEKSVALMETVLKNVTATDVEIHDFEETVFAGVEDEPDVSVQEGIAAETPSRPGALSMRLEHVLNVYVPAHTLNSNQLVKEFGRPSALVRYWLPATVLLLSGSTLLRFIVNRKAALKTWMQDLGATMIDFWANWVVQPVKKIIGTIRHDEDSEVAIMSKRSLQGDQESLERMVVSFVVDNPTTVDGHSLSETELADVRVKVKEGDLTPVLKAYERDLRKPFMGTVRGDLIRALLIQIQKTKVDVEVAIGGIDALLKSQELVFGFVGLTPGVLVCLGVFRWLNGVFGSKQGVNRGKKQGQIMRVLRNIDRILTEASSSNNNDLSYRAYGLLLCEVHVLRQEVKHILPKTPHRDFLEDVEDLIDIRTGIQKQLKVVDRIRWAYAKWLR